MKTPNKNLKKGTLVEINRRHAGCRGSIGRISRKAPEMISGHAYYSVRMTSGKGAGWTILFTEGELNLI
jgi:hypothetical protein